MKKLSGETIAKIKTLHEAGESERAIAKATGVSRSAVWYQVQKPRVWFEIRLGGGSHSCFSLKEAKDYIAEMATGFLNKHPNMRRDDREYWIKNAPKQKIFKVMQSSQEVS